MGSKLPLEAMIAEVQAKIDKDLFPLALSPFEKFVLWDETTAHPMTSFIELHFASGVNFQVLEDAFAFAVHCHPLLCSTVEESSDQLYWLYDPTFRLKLLRFPDTPYLPNGHVWPMDLFKEPGLRVWLHEHQHGTVVVLQCHHSSADGVGLRRFLIDALTYYASHTSSGDQIFKQTWSRLDPNSLRNRYDFSGAFSDTPTHPLSTWQRIKNAYYFHFKTPRALSASNTSYSNTAYSSTSDASKVRHAALPLAHGQLDRDTSSQVLERCRVEEIGVNNLAISLLFEACCLWNQRHGKVKENTRIRILLPYDLRSRVDLRMPAANRLSFSFLGRTQADCNDRSLLLKSVSDEIGSYRQNHLPLDFTGALAAAVKHPKLTRWVIQKSRNMATSVLTYAGDISRGLVKQFPEDHGARVIGDARLIHAFGAPPVRENTNVALGVCINWGQLCFSLAWNREKFSEAACHEFLELYRSCWESWLDGGFKQNE
jgi:hypothetical protein